MRKSNWFFLGFAIIQSLLFGVIATGQILGVSGLYVPVLVIPLSLILSLLAFYLYLFTGRQFALSCRIPEKPQSFLSLSTALMIAGIVLYVLLLFIPLVRWPYTPISQKLTWDAGLYHLPKAVEMIVTSSAWDFNIAYGEYPFGYESLIALSLILSPEGYLIGTVHGLISLYLFLGFVLLLAQRTKLPYASLVFLVSVLFLGFLLARNLSANIWWIFWPEITLIGKNDVLIAAAMLSVLVHAPKSKDGPFFPVGLAMAMMIGFSIKPNAILVIILSVVLLLYYLGPFDRIVRYKKELVWGLIVFLPGGLWVIRNFLVQQNLFSASALKLSSWSIANNITNPYFYKYIPTHLYVILGVILIAMIFSISKVAFRFDVISIIVLLLTFMLTPASAFLGSNQQPTQIEWRFAIGLLAYTFLLLLKIFEPIILSVYNRISKYTISNLASGMLVILVCIWAVGSNRNVMQGKSGRDIILRDQYRNPVGVDGYHSAYDYVQKNVRNSVVIIENGLPYYLYDPGFTNSVTRSRPADYVVFLQTPWIDEGGYPDRLEGTDWLKDWDLIYEDPEGRVYKRK